MFYIPGFDRFPPRRYREFYRGEAARQAWLSGQSIARSPGRGGGFGWHVEVTIEGRCVASDVEVLGWADIVRRSMSGSIVATYLQMVSTAWLYLSCGAPGRLTTLRKGPVIAALYPVCMLLAQLALAASAAAGVASAAWRLSPVLPGPVSVALAAATLFGMLRAFRAWDRRLHAYYLRQDFAFAARHRGGYDPEMEARLEGFVRRIRSALSGDVDEVLVIGHSSGAHYAVSVMADLERAGVPGGGPALSLLTLGQAIPMVSYLPEADRLRADLHRLSRSTRTAWVDVTAPGDGCAFALCDPVAVSGVAPALDRTGPLILSAAITRTLWPETFRWLRWRFLRLHFQYLCAFGALPNDPGAYYFAVTAGPMTLADRFAGRRFSASRIDRPVLTHTSMAA